MLMAAADPVAANSRRLAPLPYPRHSAKGIGIANCSWVAMRIPRHASLHRGALFKGHRARCQAAPPAGGAEPCFTPNGAGLLKLCSAPTAKKRKAAGQQGAKPSEQAPRSNDAIAITTPMGNAGRNCVAIANAAAIASRGHCHIAKAFVISNGIATPRP